MSSTPSLGLRSRIKLARFALLRAELRIAPTEAQRLFLVTIAIGAVCGLAAVGFHLAIAAVEQFLIANALAQTGVSGAFWTILTPTMGGLVAGLLLAYVVPGARGSGVPQVKAAYASPDGEVPFRDGLGKFFISALQIGSGASLGREGPTVQICAGIARGVGRLLQLPPQKRRRLIPVGAAAGIAAAFNAPLAAVTFTIEEVVGTLDQTVLSGVIVAAALAAVIERSVLGKAPILGVREEYGLSDARSLLLYAALGVAAAGVSLVFSDGFLRVRAFFKRQKRIPLWAQPAVGGLVTGILAVIVIACFGTTGVTGGGYDTLKEALGDHLTVRVMLALCVAKLIATIASYSSGGAGGIFAPALFVGAMLGGAFGSLDRTLFHHPDQTLGAFALVGMGAVFSGTIRAPITSVLIIVEMTSGYGLILPLMIANMSAYAIARSIRPRPIYDALLAQDGISLRDHGRDAGTLESITLASLPMSGPFVTLAPNSDAMEMARVRRETRAQSSFPVADGDGKLLGMVSDEHMKMVEEDPDLKRAIVAADVMMPVTALRKGDDLRTALNAVRLNDTRQVPVVDDAGKLVALVDEATIAKVYLHARAPKSII